MRRERGAQEDEDEGRRREVKGHIMSITGQESRIERGQAHCFPLTAHLWALTISSHHPIEEPLPTMSLFAGYRCMDIYIEQLLALAFLTSRCTEGLRTTVNTPSLGQGSPFLTL